ncbi:MAG: hypothetical protein ACKVX9_21780 [Blastocatellia bacterium]
MKQSLLALAFFFITVPVMATSAEEYKVEALGPLTEASVVEGVRKSLNEKGLRVLDPKGKAVCEIWFRKLIPTAKNDVAGASFGQIPEGTFMGVIRFPANTSDFRGQGVKAGYYTLRFALILQDGNHLGVSPARDFFLLCPVTEDKDPAVQLKTDELIRWSRAASGAGHPSPWSLTLPVSEKDLPQISQNEHEHVILDIKLATSAGPLVIGMIVVGRTEG